MSSGAAVGVVVVNKYYPHRGPACPLPPELDAPGIFHAGTSLKEGQPVASGGRVACVTAHADSIQEARDKVYRTIPTTMLGLDFRKDIAETY